MRRDDVEKEWRWEVVLNRSGEGFMYGFPTKDHCLNEHRIFADIDLPGI